MNILLDISYDGSGFCGFQVQNNGLSVCQALQDGLEALLGTRPPVKGCSRTDAGVHALHYAVNFWADCRIPMEKLPLALNQKLPAAIRVNRAMEVEEEFHARYAAHAKTYCYRIWNSPIDSAFGAGWHHRLPGRLDEAAMQAAADRFVGSHDFMSLCSAGCEVAQRGSTVRTITQCRVQRAGDLVTVTVTADGYLYNMVRILAGTLVLAGQHKLNPEQVPAILESRDRSQAGPTLPAQGLFLAWVDYPELPPWQAGRPQGEPGRIL